MRRSAAEKPPRGSGQPFPYQTQRGVIWFHTKIPGRERIVQPISHTSPPDPIARKHLQPFFSRCGCRASKLVFLPQLFSVLGYAEPFFSLWQQSLIFGNIVCVQFPNKRLRGEGEMGVVVLGGVAGLFDKDWRWALQLKYVHDSRRLFATWMLESLKQLPVGYSNGLSKYVMDQIRSEGSNKIIVGI